MSVKVPPRSIQKSQERAIARLVNRCMAGAWARPSAEASEKRGRSPSTLYPSPQGGGKTLTCRPFGTGPIRHDARMEQQRMAAIPKRGASRQRVARFHRRVELGGIAALLARPVARALPPAERHVVVDARRRQVDHHHARL